MQLYFGYDLDALCCFCLYRTTYWGQHFIYKDYTWIQLIFTSFSIKGYCYFYLNEVSPILVMESKSPSGLQEHFLSYTIIVTKSALKQLVFGYDLALSCFFHSYYCFKCTINNFNFYRCCGGVDDGLMFFSFVSRYFFHVYYNTTYYKLQKNDSCKGIILQKPFRLLKVVGVQVALSQ